MPTLLLRSTNHPIAIAVVGNTQIGFSASTRLPARQFATTSSLLRPSARSPTRDNLATQLGDIRAMKIGHLARARSPLLQRSSGSVRWEIPTRFKAPRRITIRLACLCSIVFESSRKLFLHFGFNIASSTSSARQFGALENLMPLS